jgi:hypothetical protein
MTTLKQLIATNKAALAGMDYVAMAAYFNTAQTVENPVKEPPKTPKRLTLNDVFGAVAAAAPNDLAKSKDIPDWMIDRAELAMNLNDRTAMANWLVSIGAAAGLSAEAKAALTALLAVTVDDPAWTATIAAPSKASAAGLGAVTAADVQRALGA